MNDEAKKPNMSYYDAAHAMHSGVATELGYDPASGTPKHLRTGVNSAMVSQDALLRLLVAKDIITRKEYYESLEEAMNDEVRRYEALLSDHFGTKITLG